MKRLLVLFMAAAALMLMAVYSSADVPHLLNVQGLLTDAEGRPLPDQSYSVMFSIYNSESGGSALWSETRSVATLNGLFTIYLGQSNPLPSSLFDNVELWLGVAVEGEAEMTPRQRLTAAPYVFRAVSADSAGFAFSLAENSVGSEQIIDGTIELADLNQNGAGINQVIKWNGSVWSAANDETGSGGGWVDDGPYVRLTSPEDLVGIGMEEPDFRLDVLSAATAIRGRTTGGGAHAGVYGRSESDGLGVSGTSTSGRGVYGASSNGFGGYFLGPKNYFSGKVGIGTESPAYKLTVNGEISIASGDESKYHINYYDGGLNFAETGVQDRRIHISDGGNVGIGTANPGAKFGVNGDAKINNDLQVNGAYKGNISSSSDNDGAPFPRPAYDSGWLDIAPGQFLTLNHNIGANREDYVVDLQFLDEDVLEVHCRGLGGWFSEPAAIDYYHGADYLYLRSNSITVHRWQDDYEVDKIRVRIWVVK
jgi:hypothetical protein